MDTTTNLNLPIPNENAVPPTNISAEFPRIALAFVMLDTIIHTLQGVVAGKANSEHEQAISTITGLTEALAAKMPANATFSLDDLTDVQGAADALVNYVLVKKATGQWEPSTALAALGIHNHSIAEVVGLAEELLAIYTAVGMKADAAMAVRVNAAQSFDAAERGQARANIGGGVLAGHRNKLINGAARIIQRGGRTIAAGASAYVFDRFLVTNNTNQTVTVTQTVFALGSGFAREARNAMRFNFAVAPTTGTLRIEQRIEFVDSIRSTDHTFIAWMSGPNGSEALAAELVQKFGTGGSPSAQVVTPMIFAGSSPTTIHSASTNRRAWGVTVPSLSGKLFGINGNDYAAAALVMSPRQAGNYELTWLSFVEGDATSEDDPFSPRHSQQEVALCQRFFTKTYEINASITSITATGALTGIASGGNVEITWCFPIRMRGLPSVVTYAPDIGTVGFWSLNVNRPSTSIITLGSSCVGLRGAGAASGASHHVHATADAEL